jgi:chromosome partitioning protein
MGLLTLNALVAADSVLIPLQTEYFALEGLSQFSEMLHAVRQHLNPRLRINGILPTMFDPRLKLAREVVKDAERYFGNQTLRTKIPRNVRLAEAPSFGKPAIVYDIASAGAQAYLRLAAEVIARTIGAPSDAVLASA